MEKKSYLPRFIVIVLIALIIGQFLTINYMKSEFDNKLGHTYEAVNQASIMMGAMVNILEQKGIMSRDELLNEANQISDDLFNLIKTQEEEVNQDK